VRDIYRDLSMDQPLRKVHDSNGYEKVQTLLDKMMEILGDEDEDEELDDGTMKQSTSAAYANRPMPTFTVRLDDPAGNSFIEFVDSMADPKWNLRMYQRTLQQNVDLGLVSHDEVQVSTVQGVSADDILKGDLPVKEAETSEPVTSDEIFVFPGPCSSCGHPINTLMKKVNIPYFKVSLWANEM
jgi:zinc finger protein